MKKIIMLAMIIMATAQANAQNEEGSWSIMPKVGVGIADMTGKLYDPSYTSDYDPTLHPITSLVAGLEAEYGINDQLGLAFGFQYSTQGCKTNDNWLKLKTDYINIPLMLQVYPIPECGLAIKAGAQIGFTVRKKVTIDGVTYDADGHWIRYGNRIPIYVESEFSRSFNKVDFSIPLGLSFEFLNFVIDARYNLGLTNVFKDDPEKSKNSVFQLTLGYKIGFYD